jgi:UDPglucose 6-dehydrogenase
MEERVGRKAMLLPGLGFSGGTIARDLQTLRSLGDEREVETQLFDGVWASNKQQLGVVIEKLQRALGSFQERRIAVWGLTYKPETSTLRRSASLEIVAALAKGGAKVNAHDPKADRAEVARQSGFTFHEDVYEAVRGADAVALVTGWGMYRDLDFRRVKDLMNGALIVDVHNMLDASVLEELGFTYLDKGRGRGIAS